MNSILDTIISYFYHYEPTTYDFNYGFIYDENVQNALKNEGYVVIKNIISDESIQVINDAFDVLTSSKNFYMVEGFITSTNYGHSVHAEIHQLLSKVNQQFLGKIINAEVTYHDLINLLAVKFNKDKKGLFPHQDISLIDETKGPSFFAWIPAETITSENGALLVLPESHKWFRWQKTYNQLWSPLKNVHNEILKWMVPVYMNKGDVLLFDSSLLHASLPNHSNKVRISMNTSFAPKEFPLVNYQVNENNSSEIYKYFVDEKFFINFYERPNTIPKQYHPPVIEKFRSGKLISKQNFIDIVKNKKVQ